MRVITDFVDKLFKSLLGFRPFYLLRQSKKIKVAFEHVNYLAGQKKLAEAVSLSEKALVIWPTATSEIEKWYRNLVVGNLTDHLAFILNSNLSKWKEQITKAQKLISEAEEEFIRYHEDPFEQENVNLLERCLAKYKDASLVVNDKKIVDKTKKLEQKIEQHQLFNNLIAQAHTKQSRFYFKQAKSLLAEAQQIFTSPTLECLISDCESNITRENEYEEIIHQSKTYAKQGELEKAFSLAQKSSSIFARQDGQELMALLEKGISSKKLIRDALSAEKFSDWKDAKEKYLKVLDLLPKLQLPEVYFRLSMMLTYEQEYEDALFYIKEIDNEESIYLKGFIFAKQENWRSATREWRKLSDLKFDDQRDILKKLIVQDRLRLIQSIEDAVTNEDYLLAKNNSQIFLQKFAHDQMVESNLNEHIVPLMKLHDWQNKSADKLVEWAKQRWIEYQDLKSLHNFVIALYNQVYEKPEFFNTQLKELVHYWAMALFNIKDDPILSDIPWLADGPIDINDLSQRIITKITELIDKVKEHEPEYYLTIRDSYRLEFVTLGLMNDSNEANLKLLTKNNLLITPGVYINYPSQFESFNLPASPIGALYTDWGLAIAACLDGDIERGVKIKPRKTPITPAENYGESFISYYEGCFYLKERQWQQAIKPLTKAKSIIQSSAEFISNLDQLCFNQRAQIDDFNESVDFSKFYYELLNTERGKAYYAEYQAEKIRKRLLDEKINEDKAYNELGFLKNIDPQNPVVLDLMKKVSYVREKKKIQQCLKRKDLNGAVRLAKNSSDPEVKFETAAFFIGLAIASAKERSLTWETMRELCRYAYDICPHEPDFQPVYEELNIPY